MVEAADRPDEDRVAGSGRKPTPVTGNGLEGQAAGGADGSLAVRPRLGVSSCLLGEPVRYNGGHSRHRFLTDTLAPYVEWVPCCPEIEIGLGAPRPPLRLRTGGRLTTAAGDTDHTAAIAAVAAARRDRLASLAGYVFKARSPSCGLASAREYAEDKPVRGNARGAFAARLLEGDPLLPAEEDGRLADPVLREAFVERVFARARLLALFGRRWRIRDLVVFHSRHKLQLLAHDPGRCRELGRLVAAAADLPPPSVEARYTRLFGEAMARRVTLGRHSDALQHAFGMVSDRLDPVRRRDILAAIAAHRRREVPLSVPVALIRHHAVGFEASYLASQTYLDPFPATLGLRNHV